MTQASPTTQSGKPQRMRDILRDADRVLDERQRHMATQLESMRQARGEVLYDITWMPPQRARRLYWFDRLRRIIGLVELGVVFLALLGIWQLLAMLLQQFLGLKD